MRRDTDVGGRRPRRWAEGPDEPADDGRVGAIDGRTGTARSVRRDCSRCETCSGAGVASLIAVLGTALVFAMTLVLAGLSAAFVNEVDPDAETTGADEWAIAAGATGPFNSSAVARRRTLDGPQHARRAGRRSVRRDRRDDPGRHARARDDDRRGPGGVGSPTVDDGRARTGRDRGRDRLGKDIGDTVPRWATRDLKVVGTVNGSSLLRRDAERVPHDLRRRAGAHVRRRARSSRRSRCRRPPGDARGRQRRTSVSVDDTKPTCCSASAPVSQTINFLACSCGSSPPASSAR